MMSSFVIPTITFVVFVTSFSAVTANTDQTVKFSIEEELPSGYLVGSVANETKDFFNTTATNLLYNFLSQTDHTTELTIATMFSINDRTGEIFTSVKIDRETICEYNSVCMLIFDVAVIQEDGPFFQTVPVHIIIEDMNDNSPLFEKLTSVMNISESTHINSTIRIDPAVDRDSGGNNSIQSYDLILDSETNGIFSLVVEKKLDNTFRLMLKVDKILDREVKDTYNMKVIAMDGGETPNTGTMNIVINVADTNDNKPVFTQSIYRVNISENAVSFETILILSANDKDIGENARISYRISEFQKDTDFINKLFNVNEVTGELKVKSDLTSYAGESYQFIVQAADHGEDPWSTQAQVIVHIEDAGNNPPRVSVSSLSSGNIAFVNVTENASNGTFVAHVNVEDPDKGPNGEVSCRISNQHFGVEAIEGGKGFRVFVQALLDREVKNIHNITILCSDKGQPILSNSTSFLVRVTDKNDNRPVFEKLVYSAKLFENKKGNEVITQVAATDADESKNGMVQYSLHGDALDQFIVDKITGVVSVNKVFDREENSEVTFRVLAVDGGSPALTGTATVVLTIEDENDNAPAFFKSVHGLTILENQPTGTDVATLEAFDDDAGVNAQFDFSIASDYVDKVPFILFSDGLLKANKQLDREERSRYDFVVIVTDHGTNPLKSSAHVTVIVEDTNDNAPIVTFPKPSNNSVTVFYPDFESIYVTTIEAYDVDEGKNKELEFSIKSGNDLNIFGIDSVTGELVFDEKLDIGSDKILTLEISVKDKGQYPLETVKSLHIELMYTNATSLVGTDEDSSKYIIISVVVVIVTLVISGGIIGVILFLRTLDKKRKQKDLEDSQTTDSDFGFTITQSHTMISNDTLSSGSGEGHDLVKKKEVSFILDTSDNLDYHQQKPNSSMSSTGILPMLEKPSKSSLRYTPSTELSQNGLDTRELQNEANIQLHTMKVQQVMLQNRAQQWVHSQQQQYGTLPHEDHHSDGSGETIGSDSGRGCSEEDDVFSTPSADDPKLFEVSSPESTHCFMPPHPADIYEEAKVHRTSSYVKQPWTRKPNHAHRDFKTSQNYLNLNRNLHRNMNTINCDDVSNSYMNAGQSRVSWGSAYYGSVAPMDYTGDSALHSFFDKTPVAYSRDDDDCSTTTSGSYTIYSEEIL